jgi:hypothetical protein
VRKVIVSAPDTVVRGCEALMAWMVKRGMGRGLVAAAVTAVLAGVGATGGVARASTPQWQTWYTMGSNTSMDSVAAFGPKDIWAVGSRAWGSPFRPDVVQWNGTKWQPVPVPGSAGYYTEQVAGSAASNVWIFASNTSGNAVAFRWDRKHWHTIKVPYGRGWVVLSPTDVWIAGEPGCQLPVPTSGPWTCSTPLYHWTGRTWQTTRIGEWINEIAAAPGSAVWAAGTVPYDLSLTGPLSAYEWNASARKWMAVRMPHPTVGTPTISVGAAHDVWVGFAPANSAEDAVLHWNGSIWKQITVSSSITGTVGVPQVTADGHGGVWLRDWGHYTGGTWVYTGSYSGVPAGEANETELATVPGAPSSYVESAYTGPSSGPYRGGVFYYGPKP